MTETCIFKLKHTSFYSKMSHLVYDRIFSPSLPECTDNVTNSVSNKFSSFKIFFFYFVWDQKRSQREESEAQRVSLTNSNNKLS